MRERENEDGNKGCERAGERETDSGETRSASQRESRSNGGFAQCAHRRVAVGFIPDLCVRSVAISLFLFIPLCLHFLWFSHSFSMFAEAVFVSRGISRGHRIFISFFGLLFFRTALVNFILFFSHLTSRILIKYTYTGERLWLSDSLS